MIFSEIAFIDNFDVSFIIILAQGNAFEVITFRILFTSEIKTNVFKIHFQYSYCKSSSSSTLRLQCWKFIITFFSCHHFRLYVSPLSLFHLSSLYVYVAISAYSNRSVLTVYAFKYILVLYAWLQAFSFLMPQFIFQKTIREENNK